VIYRINLKSLLFELVVISIQHKLACPAILQKTMLLVKAFIKVRELAAPRAVQCQIEVNACCLVSTLHAWHRPDALCDNWHPRDGLLLIPAFIICEKLPALALGAVHGDYLPGL
jgi:hypothetical protein